MKYFGEERDSSRIANNIVKERQKLNNIKNKLINIYSYELDANIKEINAILM